MNATGIIKPRHYNITLRNSAFILVTFEQVYDRRQHLRSVLEYLEIFQGMVGDLFFQKLMPVISTHVFFRSNRLQLFQFELFNILEKFYWEILVTKRFPEFNGVRIFTHVICHGVWVSNDHRTWKLLALEN